MVLLRCRGEAARCLEDVEHAVKCPKCGFVGYPGVPRCKKCGHIFEAADSEAAPPRVPPKVPSASPPEESTSFADSPFPFSPPLPPKTNISSEVATPETALERGAPLPDQGAQTAAWRDELSGRIEDFRRKRSRVKGGFDPNTSLDLEFGGPAAEFSSEDPKGVIAAQSDRDPFELDVALSPSKDGGMALDSVPLEQSGDYLGRPGSKTLSEAKASSDPGEAEEEPVEIILESPSSHSPAPVPRALHEAMHVAPLGLRFVAALADGLVLLLGGAVFTLIFWAAGGHISPRPFNLLIVGSIAALFVLAYFGLFTALSASTPGLLWMNLEVRSMDGAAPTPQEAFWRAFGYLVSIASLLLGFVWSCVDGDHLSWHDHMSGTYISLITG
jgi:uncharacterized RDD family membrane protein YckC/rubredoxin